MHGARHALVGSVRGCGSSRLPREVRKAIRKPSARPTRRGRNYPARAKWPRCMSFLRPGTCRCEGKMGSACACACFDSVDHTVFMSSTHACHLVAQLRIGRKSLDAQRCTGIPSCGSEAPARQGPVSLVADPLMLYMCATVFAFVFAFPPRRRSTWARRRRRCRRTQLAPMRRSPSGCGASA